MIAAYFAYRMLKPILWRRDLLVPLATTTCAGYRENFDLPATVKLGVFGNLQQAAIVESSRTL